MNTTITQAHQSKPAYIYVRQSTLAQVRHNQESTERQYALREKAIQLGWPPEVGEPTVRPVRRALHNVRCESQCGRTAGALDRVRL